jgi:hypothetical protein
MPSYPENRFSTINRAAGIRERTDVESYAEAPRTPERNRIIS